MFEQSVVDNSRQKRSKWSWMGLVIQAGLVTGMLLVPMISPQVLSVIAPTIGLYVPLKPIAQPEVEVKQQSAANSTSQNSVAVARPAARPFTVPTSYDRPVAMIDDGGIAPPAFTIGSSTVQASSGPFLPGSGTSLPSAPPPKADPPKKEAAKPIRVGGEVQAANILSRVNPTYPPLAKQARVSGTVKLEGVIAKDGTIQKLKVLSGHPLLVKAAVDAVQQWRYRPTHLNGEPVEVIAPIDVNFILSN